jgi:type IV secretory pathway TrbF-like protein
VSSSNGRPPRPASARLSVLVGLLSTLTMPAAILATRWSDAYELLHAAAAIPLGALLGIGAILLARRARSRLAPTLGHPRGTRTARLGRLLGLLGFLLALTAAGSVAVYEMLKIVAD